MYDLISVHLSWKIKVMISLIDRFLNNIKNEVEKIVIS